jgi:hypothetical protein
MKALITVLVIVAMSTNVQSQLKDTLLKEVVIKAKKPLLVQAIDRTIVNVDAMIGSATSNTLEVLEKTPGVSLNSNGDISLNGRSGVMVLINGRSTYMSGQDLAAYLKSIPGASLDKIELMDNPPARYDASGNAIINIRLKRNRAGGLTGNFATAYSQGRYARTNNALNLAYNTKKINLFTNVGFNTEDAYTNDFYDRRFYNSNAELISTVLLENKMRSRRDAMNINAGMDYYASQKTTVGMIFNINKSEGNSRLNYESQNSQGITTNLHNRTNFSSNLNMLHKFNDQGNELSAEVNYLRYEGTGYQQMESFLYDLPGKINIYTANADYVLPLKNKAKLEAGVKSSLVDNKSVYDYYDINGATKTIDHRKSNHFNYHENMNAAYINGQKSWGRFGMQVGFRVENTDIKGNDEAATTMFTKNYNQLFHSIFLNYKLDSAGKNVLGFMVNRRINRPNYQMMNPFLIFRDNYSYNEGNPDLNPQYQNRYELKFQHRQLLTMGLSYNRFTNVIFQTTQAVDSIFITRPDNIAKGFMLLLNTTVSVSPGKWWNLNTTLRLSHLGIRGQVYDQPLTPQTNLARFELQNYFTISKTINAELGGYYASRDLSGQTFTKGMYRVFASFQKKVLNEKASIRIGFDDIFHSWVYKNRSISLKQAEYFQISESDTQRVGLAFTYSFGKKSVTRKRRQNENAAEEKNRIDL